MAELTDLSDQPLQPAPRPDLITVTRLALRVPSSGEKAVLAIYRPPGYIRWGIETLANLANNASLETAGTVLLQRGIVTIRRFPGLATIRTARQTAAHVGCPETMHWLGDFPHVEVHLAGTDDTGELRLRTPIDLAKEIANMARHLGLSHSKLARFALMAGLLEEPRLTALPYREAMVKTLRSLGAAIKRRAEKAQNLTAEMNPGDADGRKWTLSDVTDLSDSNDFGGHTSDDPPTER